MVPGQSLCQRGRGIDPDDRGVRDLILEHELYEPAVAEGLVNYQYLCLLYTSDAADDRTWV